MKVLMPGKGGSGKTTMTAAIATWFANHRCPTLVIDGDVNQGVSQALGMTPARRKRLVPIGSGEQALAIKRQLAGNNPRIPDPSKMLKTTPMGRGSNTVSLSNDDPILQGYGQHMGKRLHVLAPGDFSAEQLGTSCFHAVNGIGELILNHTLEHPSDELVIVDSTAGADTFASGLFARFDKTVLVTRPDKKGLGVVEQYVGYLRAFREEHDIDIDVTPSIIVNGVTCTDDVEYVDGKLRAMNLNPDSTVIGRIKDDRALRALGREEITDARAVATLIMHNKDEMEKIGAALTRDLQDRDRWQKLGEFVHRLNADRWGSAAMGMDLNSQIDPGFVIPAPVSRDGLPTFTLS